jgi:hypothetical protein
MSVGSGALPGTNEIRPFIIETPEGALQDLYARISATR